MFNSQMSLLQSTFCNKSETFFSFSAKWLEFIDMDLEKAS